jgi:hypothetical protein
MSVVNPWIAKSIELANKEDYLDRLWEVYPVALGGERPLSPILMAEITKAHGDRKPDALVRALLKAPRFPIDHPFAALIRKGYKTGIADRNPETLRQIGEPLLRMELGKLLGLCMKPVAPNVTMGPMFPNWLRTLGYPFLKRDQFDPTQTALAPHDVAFLDGKSDADLKGYANEILGCALARGIDLLFRVGKNHYIGEAKWLGTTGGKQTTSFNQAMDFLGAHSGHATRMLVLDGVMWLEGGEEMQVAIRHCENIALSALLLREFTESLRR